VSLGVYCGAALLPEAARAITERQFRMLITPQNSDGIFALRLQITPARIQDLYPVQDIAETLCMGACIADDASTQCSRDTHAELKTTPAQRGCAPQQTFPADSSIGKHKGLLLRQRLNVIGG
jgi:hypothetical protein